MFDKMERFKQWRGEEYQKEEKYIQTALLIDQYIDSIRTAHAIQADLKNTTSKQFVVFDQYKARSLGFVLFFKLTVDQFLDSTPEDELHSPLRQQLGRLNTSLSFLYTNPSRVSKSDIDHLTEVITELLEIDDRIFLGQDLTKKLFFALYATLHIIHASLSNLHWMKEALVKARGINIAQLKDIVVVLQENTRAKIDTWTIYTENARSTESTPDTAELLQQHLNKSCIETLEKSSAFKDKLIQLDAKISLFSTEIIRLIDLIKAHHELQLKLNMLTSLLDAAHANDQQITARAYFHELIAQHTDSYNLLIENSDGIDKELFLEKVNQLQTAMEHQYFSLRAAKGLSVTMAPIIRTYRTWTPQIVQDLVTNYLPTLDSECKAQLKELIKDCLARAQKQSAIQEEQILAINIGLFDEKILLENDSVAHLEVVLKRVQVMKTTVETYNKSFILIEQNMAFLQQYKSNAVVLQNFIRLHDGFLVALTNFFAQFLPIFKTNSARMIDAARQCKQKIEIVIENYQDAVSKEMEQLQKDPGLSQDIKQQLHYQFHGLSHDNTMAINKRNVRLLIKSLNQFFDSQSPVKRNGSREEELEPSDILSPGL